MITTWRLLPCGCEILRTSKGETTDRYCGWHLLDDREQPTDAVLLGGDPDEVYDALRDAEVDL